MSLQFARTLPIARKCRSIIPKALVSAAKSSENLKDLPGEFGPRFIGDTLTFLFNKKKYEETMQKNKMESKIWRFEAFGQRFVFIHDPETILRITDADHELVTTVRPEQALYHLTTSENILNTELPDHEVLRQAYFRAMSNQAMEQYVPATYTAVRSALADSAKQEQPISIWFKEGIALAIALLCSRYEPELAAKETALMMSAFKLFGFQPVPATKQADAIAAEMTDLLRPVVEAAMKEGTAATGNVAPGSLSTSLICNLANGCDKLGLKRDGESWVKFAMSQLYANSATVPSISLHIMSAFGRFPEAAAKVREEQARVAKTHGEAPTWRALEACSYGERFVKEVMRLGHLPQNLPRRVKKDMNINGYFVPKGVTLALLPTHVPKSPEWADTWGVFDPDRWIATPRPSNYKPFGSGPRTCAGRAAGMMQLRVVAWELARSYDVEGAVVGKTWLDVPVYVDQLRLVPRGQGAMTSGADDARKVAPAP